MTTCRDLNCEHYTMTENPYVWVRTCEEYNRCPLEDTFTTVFTLAERLKQVRELLENEHDAGLAAHIMRHWPEISQVDLDDLALACSTDSYVHKNDVWGLIETFEKRWAMRASRIADRGANCKHT